MSDIPPIVKQHLEKLINSSSLKDRENAFEEVAENWQCKLDMFYSQIEALGMELVDNMETDDARAALLFTFSGSLVALGYGKERRQMEYASINLRTDVPEIVKDEAAVLAEPPVCGNSLRFNMGSVQKTSPIYTIAVCKADVLPDEQETRVTEATIYLTNGFLQANKMLALPENPNVDRFTLDSMVKYLAKKNDLTVKKTKELMDSFLVLAEAGMLLGETVSLGRLGRFMLKKRAPQKARVIRNPATGEQMTVSAKPEHMEPIARFSKKLKERAYKVPVYDKEGSIEPSADDEAESPEYKVDENNQDLT